VCEEMSRAGVGKLVFDAKNSSSATAITVTCKPVYIIPQAALIFDIVAEYRLKRRVEDFIKS
jgi:hypothetical protein